VNRTNTIIEIREPGNTLTSGSRPCASISFSVDPGSIHGFVGPNGAGKTTTLKNPGDPSQTHSAARFRVFRFGCGCRLQKNVGAKDRFLLPDHFSPVPSNEPCRSIWNFFLPPLTGMDLAARNRVVGDVPVVEPTWRRVGMNFD